MISKRRLILDGYDTAIDGLWTMSSCKITKAPQIQLFLDVPSRYAPLDVSTTLTDGQPYYGSASLYAFLESSEGDMSERQSRIDCMVNFLDGRCIQIVHPDHPNHYMVGRVQVTQEYNDLAHCAVSVNAICEAWFYAAEQTVVTLEATATAQTAQLLNSGRMAIVPDVNVDGTVFLSFGANSWTLPSGDHTLPDLLLTPGTVYKQPAAHEIIYSGEGSITFRYREAVLAT